jgi:predicted  nucleic acid-binding Zn-ribbon protein
LTIKDLDKGEKQMAQELLKYQTIDANLKKIETELSGSEERKKAVSAKKYIDGVEDNVNKLDDRSKELVSAYEQATNEQLKLKEQQEDLMRSLEEAEDENAVNFLLKKAEELIAKIKTLGKKATQIEAEIQSVLKEYATIKNTSKAAQNQYSEYSVKYSELKKSLKDKNDAVVAQLEELKAKVDGALMERYLKKREGKMYPIIYKIRGNSCGACNMELSAAELNKLKKGEVIDCGNCGRMLYQD